MNGVNRNAVNKNAVNRNAVNKNGGSMKKYAVVTQTNPLRIKFDGEETASDNLYNRLGSYNPQNGDRVVVDVEDGKYLILGKVVK